MKAVSRLAVRTVVGSAVAVLVACISCGGGAGNGAPANAPSPAGASPAQAQAASRAALAASIAQMTPEQKQSAYQAEIAALKARGPRLTAYLDGFPKPLTDLDALAASIKTPQAAFEYVRDRIALEPYPGVLKGALGTLLTRGGNDLDRALLLGALLKAQGVTFTIGHGQVSPADAQRIAAQIAAAPDAVDQILKTLPASPAAPATGDAADARALFTQGIAQRRADVGAAVDQTFPLLSSSLRTAGVTLGQDSTPKRLEALEDHYWIEITDGDKTVPYDASTAQVGQRLATTVDTLEPGTLSSDLFQRIGIRMVVEHLQGGQTQRTQVLSKTVRAVDVLGKSIRLAVEPESGNATANQFKPVLQIDTDSMDGTAFALRPAPGAPTAPPADDSPGGLGAGLGGLGGVAGPPPPPPPPASSAAHAPGDGPVLGRVFVEITTKAPHLPDARDRRVLMDRMEPIAGAKQQISAALADDKSIRALLVTVWDGAISVGPFHPLYALRQSVATMAAQEPLEEKAQAKLYLGQDAGDADVPAPMLASNLVNYFMASDLTRHGLQTKGAPHVRSYYERPRLAVVRHGFAVADWSKPGQQVRYLEGIDLLNAPFAFVGPTDESAALAMKAGIADTALERSFDARMAAFNTLPLFAAASGQNVSLVTLKDAQGLGAVVAPAPIRSVMREDVNAGRALVAPSRLVSIDGQPQYGWWSVDPQTGYTLGRMDLGGAQGLVEAEQINQKIAQWTEAFVKFYGSALKCYMGAMANALGSVDVTIQPSGNGLSVNLNHGQNPMPGSAEVLGCLIDAACDVLADLIATEIGQAADFNEVKNFEDLITNLFMQQVGSQAKDLGNKACSGALKNALGGK